MKGRLALIILIPLLTLPQVSGYAMEGESEWLVMVYMSGENNLAKIAAKDLGAILSFRSEDIATAVLYDDHGPSRLYLQRAENRDEVDMGELNLGNPETLSRFLDTAISTFPAEKMMLIIWGHGSAWRGFCWDGEERVDQLTIPEFSRALSPFPQMDIIFFHSCLMANIETLYQIRDRTKFVVASEDLLIGGEVEFGKILRRIEGKESEEVARFLVDEYMDMRVLKKIVARIKRLDIGLGVIDMGKLKRLVESINALVGIDSSVFENLNVKEFEKYHTVDLYSLASKIAKSEDEEVASRARELMEAVKDCVVYLRYRGKGCHGISITFTRSEMDEGWGFEDLYPNLEFSLVSLWDEVVFSLLDS